MWYLKFQYNTTGFILPSLLSIIIASFPNSRKWLPQLLIYSILEYTENKFQNVNPYHCEKQTCQLVFNIYL